MEMKRDILFRGKIRAKNKWVFGDFLHLPIENAILSDKGYAIIEPETVGQFTGLIDKNGKKIFEGDIINYEYETFNKQKILVKYVIQYNADEARFRAELTNDGIMYDLLAFRETQKRAEVIGNIYDNEELLKK